jgi:branched-chain amino acid transport system permease protein
MLALVLTLLAVLPLLNLNEYVMHIMIMSFIFGILAASWDLLVGYAGQLNFGHAAFLGIGAYTSAILNKHLGVSPWLGLPVGSLAAMAFGVGLGFPALRLRGHYLALTTLAFAETSRIIVNNWIDVTGGPYGIFGYSPFPGIPFTKPVYYYLTLGALLSAVGCMRWLGNATGFGLGFRAIRDDEVLADAVGINTARYKLLAFAVSSFFAGFGGALYAHYVLLVAPVTMSPMTTGFIIGMAVLGGVGTIIGPVVGALILYTLSEYLRIFGVIYHLITVGVVIIIILLFLPEGVTRPLRGYLWR